jgi:hypothetical protein
MQIAWLISDSAVTENTLNFWNQPGLYVYTTVGNLLLFRFLWALSIFIWSRYSINYIALFQFADAKPNLVLVINETSTQCVLYCINLMVFFRANVTGSSIANTFLSYGCPSILIIMCLFYEFQQYSNYGNDISRGIFAKKVLYDLITAPFSTVTFRAVYCANTLTSLTKVIADFVYASCWIVSGAFLRSDQTNGNYGSDYLMCKTHKVKIFIAVLQIIPQYFRIMQLVHNYYKTGVTANLVNIGKYTTTVVVIVLGLFYQKANPMYCTIIVFSTLYKWLWDVVMDWGLFDVLPTLDGGCNQFNTAHHISTASRSAAPETLFLRRHLMYPSYIAYHVAIWMDLVLRFLWIVSILPQGFFGDLVGTQMTFCLASLEIVRRAMWGLLRVEFEHLKFAQKGTVGFHERRSLQVRYAP